MWIVATVEQRRPSGNIEIGADAMSVMQMTAHFQMALLYP
jgi:hypothetical protein